MARLTDFIRQDKIFCPALAPINSFLNLCITVPVHYYKSIAEPRSALVYDPFWGLQYPKLGYSRSAELGSAIPPAATSSFPHQQHV